MPEHVSLLKENGQTVIQTEEEERKDKEKRKKKCMHA